MNFWQTLKKPIFVLAPMADVTDPAFRYIIAKYSKYGGQDIGEYGKFTRSPLGVVGGPDVMWTEFVSADGLFLGGYDHLIKDLAFTEAERPIVAQFFTGRPDMMEKASELAVDLGFDGIDINMGCPDRSVEKQGGGSANITNPTLAVQILKAAQLGLSRASLARDKAPIPVSVKTRIGYNKNELETWLPALLETNPAVITIHARTRKEMSSVPARWEHIKRAVEIRNNFIDSMGRKSEALIFGNGDVVDLDDARKKVEETGCDGVMLGRAIFGNPFLFANLSHVQHGGQIEHPASILLSQSDKQNDLKINTDNNAMQSRNSAERSECDASEVSRKIGAGYVPSVPERLRVMVEHTKLFQELLPEKSFVIMRKHFKAYLSAVASAKEDVDCHRKVKELRLKLMEAKDAEEVEEIVEKYLKSNMKVE